MYIQPAFHSPSAEATQGLQRDYPFATLLAWRDGRQLAMPVPLLLDSERQMLIGHLPQNSADVALLPGEVTVLFHGPHAYVSPRWYATSGLVPTWNYALAQVSGTARLLPDAADVTRILQQLVQVFEGDAWSLDQVNHLPKLLPMIVGLEIDIRDTQAKFKLSQNRSPADINAVATALAHSPDGQAQATAALMARYAGAVLPDTHE